jgi:hypothetical protein
LEDKLAEINEQLGEEVFTKLIKANEVDLGIWEELLLIKNRYEK